MNEGWKCPVCGKVWGPHVDGCLECNGQVEYKWKFVPIPVPYVPYTPPWYNPPCVTWTTGDPIPPDSYTVTRPRAHRRRLHPHRASTSRRDADRRAVEQQRATGEPERA